MIHEEICTYEVCKLAKKKGFPQLGIDSNNYWFEDNNDKLIDMNVNAFIFDVIPKEGLTRKIPQSLLQRWLREVKGYYVYPFFDNESRRWTWVCRELTGDKWIQLLDFEERYFDTFELALVDALKYALENLV